MNRLSPTSISTDMLVKHITDFANLKPYQQRWDELSDQCVFRSWSWLTTWWKYYGAGRDLQILLVFEDVQGTVSCQSSNACSDNLPAPEALVGILPCYVESSFARGRVLRLLGDGEVCTDYLDILSNNRDVKRVACALAQNLVDNADCWDTTDFRAIGTDCTGLMHLSSELTSLNCHMSRTPNESRWSVALPVDWEAFLSMQSKSHRKQIRRLERSVAATKQIIWHPVETKADFEIAWPIMIDLHQRRRKSLGEPGCFASQRWAGFHRDIAGQLLDSGNLRLSWLELDGQPVAAEYQFANEQVTWAYQGGFDPEQIDQQPGRLSLIRTIQKAIDEGHQAFDLLRGDEPYKAHWRATPQEMVDIRIVPPRGMARWRNQACNYLQSAARTARQLTNMLSF